MSTVIDAITSSSEVEYSTSGWCCQYCGQWVPSGIAHTCPASAYVYTYQPVMTTDERLDKIIQLLERIAIKLHA